MQHAWDTAGTDRTGADRTDAGSRARAGSGCATRRRRARVLRGAVPLVAVIAVVGAAGASMPGVAAASSGGSAMIRPALLAPRSPSAGSRLGRPDPAQSVELEVVLPPSHPAQLATLLHDLYDPSSPLYQRWLAPGEFSRRFGPSARRVGAVVDWLHGLGLSDTRLIDGRVEVHATARLVSSALGTSLSQYRLADGEESVAADQTPLVPRAIAPDIAAIVGLSETTRLRPHFEVLSQAGSSRPAALPRDASSAASIQQKANVRGGWTSRQVATKYQADELWNAGLNGTGKTIALFELEGHNPSDTSGYLSCFGLHNSVTTRLVDGGSRDGPGHDPIEANLDIEDAAATAPGARIISYEGPNSEFGYLDVWAAIVDDDKAPIVSTSWGGCETLQGANERGALHPLFMQAAAQGQSIFAAAGDTGSEDCFSQDGSTELSVDSPANDPLVTAVGGTSLMPNVALTNPRHEPVWNDCRNVVTGAFCARDGGAGGGAVSRAYARPSWQPVGVGSTCGACRQVPDLSANAGVGEMFESDGVWDLTGGTSIAAPKLAGIAADISSGCVNALGSFNPRLYALAKTGVYGIALRDVPAGEGNNDLTRDNGDRFKTAAGFDLASGLGTPLASGLACPEITGVTPASAAVGARVTITGLALARATISFGGTVARVISHSSTSASVIVPSGSGPVNVSASDPMGNGTRHAAFAYK